MLAALYCGPHVVGNLLCLPTRDAIANWDALAIERAAAGAQKQRKLAVKDGTVQREYDNEMADEAAGQTTRRAPTVQAWM